MTRYNEDVKGTWHERKQIPNTIDFLPSQKLLNELFVRNVSGAKQVLTTAKLVLAGAKLVNH